MSVVGFGASDCAKFGVEVPARGFDFIGDQFTVEGYFNRQRSARLNFDMTVSGILLTTLTAFLLGSNLSTYNSAIFGCTSSLSVVYSLKAVICHLCVEGIVKFGSCLTVTASASVGASQSTTHRICSIASFLYLGTFCELAIVFQQ